MNLVHAMAQAVPSDWVQRESITFEDTAKHQLFKRVGRKDEDRRSYDLARMDDLRETIALNRETLPGRINWVERAKTQLANWDASANRARIFEDFKNGQ
jgi:E3 ubiquitin-protein ligase DOA10